jgi:hypothetical protein
MKTSSIAIQKAIDETGGGERIAASDSCYLWQLGDGRLVIETNGDPVWESDAGFNTAAVEIVAEEGRTLHFRSDEWQRLAGTVDWDCVWPEIDGDGLITGSIVGEEGGFLNVRDEAMIDQLVAADAGWSIDKDEGRASPPSRGQ